MGPYLTLKDLKALHVYVCPERNQTFFPVIGILSLILQFLIKMFFYWSAYNLLSYSYVDQWLIINEILTLSIIFFLKDVEGFLCLTAFRWRGFK